MDDQNTEQIVNPVQVQKYLGGIDYPTDKDTLLDTARDHGADENVVTTLELLPDQKFDSPNDVTEAIGELS